MPAFDLKRSLESAQKLFGEGDSRRRVRSDRGKSRLAPEVQAALRAALLGQERPSMGELLTELSRVCAERGLEPPARATLYEWLETLPVPGYEIASLPAAVRATLHNLPSTGEVPGAQLAFHCFQFGSVAAMSFAAGLPWLTLHRAAQRRGWRPGSRGALEAVLRVRGIRA